MSPEEPMAIQCPIDAKTLVGSCGKNSPVHGADVEEYDTMGYRVARPKRRAVAFVFQHTI